MSREEYGGKCPKCLTEGKMRFHVEQGDHMRVTGGPIIRVGVQGLLFCMNFEDGCDYRETSAWVDVTLEFGEAIR